jgi:leucyl aminopeptidase
MEAMLKSIGKSGKATTFLPDGSKFTIIILPDEVTRNNHPMSPHSITDSLNAAGLASTLKKTFETDADADDSTIEGADAIVSSGVQIIVVDKDIRDSIGAVAVAIARAMPVYTAKSLSKKEEEASDVSEGHVVNVSYLTTQDGELTFIDDEYLNSSAKAVADGVRLAGKLGDMPPAELTPETYSMQCRYIVEDLQKNGHSVVMEEIVGEELRERGYGGIYGVGMAAMVTPRIVIMTYTPEGSGDDVESIALCGKGVVYDTGGLSLKPKSGMPGMKHGMYSHYARYMNMLLHCDTHHNPAHVLKVRLTHLLTHSCLIE